MGKKKEKKLRKMLEKYFDVELDKIDRLNDAMELMVCDCEGQQVCDICQGVSTTYSMSDNVECEICGEFKQPNLFIGDGVCHACHDEQHGNEEINSGHYFELMDRTHVIQCNISDHLRDSPAITDEMKKTIDKVQDLLCEVYQWSGGKFDGFDK